MKKNDGQQISVVINTYNAERLLKRVLESVKDFDEIVPNDDPAIIQLLSDCLLYTSDAADEYSCVDLGGRRIIKKKFFSSRRRHTR